MREKSALLIVDLQNDFCPGGALPVPEGDKIVPIVNQYINLFKKAGLAIFASRDWHPPITRHFKKQGGIWPPHCIQSTRGADFHEGLMLPADAVIITKGANPEEDSYSTFQGCDDYGRAFADVLRGRGIEHLYVCGLATDYCVKASVIGAMEEGFNVTVLMDAIKGVDVKPGDSEKALAEMVKRGAWRATIEEITASWLAHD